MPFSPPDILVERVDRATFFGQSLKRHPLLSSVSLVLSLAPVLFLPFAWCIPPMSVHSFPTKATFVTDPMLIKHPEFFSPAMPTLAHTLRQFGSDVSCRDHLFNSYSIIRQSDPVIFLSVLVSAWVAGPVVIAIHLT